MNNNNIFNQIKIPPNLHTSPLSEQTKISRIRERQQQANPYNNMNKANNNQARFDANKIFVDESRKRVDTIKNIQI